MARLGRALSLILPLSLALGACEKSAPTNAPEPEPETTPVAVEPEVEPPAEPVEPEPPAEPADPEPESSREVNEATVTRDGFEARQLECKLDEAMSKGAGYIMAGLAKQDAAFDACAPEGAAIEVEWTFSNGQVVDNSVVATSNKLASCIGGALAKVRAGVGQATCKVVLLVGDSAAAQAAYDAR